MGERVRRKQAKAFKERECAAYTARFATADLLSNVKESVETVVATCDLTDEGAVPPVGSEVIVRARSSSSADVMTCNRCVATLDLTSAELQRLFELSSGMAIGVVREHGEITPCFTISLPQPPDTR